MALHDDVDKLLADAGPSPGDERGRLLLGGRSMVLCGSCYERARFDECRQHAAAARLHFGDEKRYGNIVLDVYLGMAAMAQGRVEGGRHLLRARLAGGRGRTSPPIRAFPRGSRR